MIIFSNFLAFFISLFCFLIFYPMLIFKGGGLVFLLVFLIVVVLNRKRFFIVTCSCVLVTIINYWLSEVDSHESLLAALSQQKYVQARELQKKIKVSDENYEKLKVYIDREMDSLKGYDFLLASNNVSCNYKISIKDVSHQFFESEWQSLAGGKILKEIYIFLINKSGGCLD
ncbi:hypothetical protein N475_24695 [Pseudoalteromonas luteoviolacea DSM 6061]|uniref:Uncharacterized protein n=2 Tax=Pseudoalteromonas luteoviolacea TaxID=43657 RepID=A0A166UG86_9GAMM|nr:hypothetical protein N475_24695 [Pseudoalteromonas luteoviolacea DSM 6061]MBE0388782.1 hypothetical protein [Pseudoalteromonas luteoviolacea DSM 6061]